jgi:hypothetical protein
MHRIEAVLGSALVGGKELCRHLVQSDELESETLQTMFEQAEQRAAVMALLEAEWKSQVGPVPDP